MGRFSLGVEKTDFGGGSVDAASLVSPLLQGISAERRRLNVAFSSLSFSSLSLLMRMPGKAFGNVRSAFVTIGDYVFSKGEKPLRGFAAMRGMASQASRAGKRVVEFDALGMTAFPGEQKAGCDAGKGVFELTAGSLAEGTLSAGRRDRMSTTARMGGNERNRVKC
jgi:hypothetical protein